MPTSSSSAAAPVNVTASFDSGASGPPSIELHAFLPSTTDADRVAESGAEPLRADAHETAAGKREVVRCRVLMDQIRAAQRRVAGAEKTFARVAAAKKLLETEPEGDLANKLRKVEAELANAEKEHAAAVADLGVIERLAPGLWPKAANWVSHAVSGVLSPRHLALMNEVPEAQAAVDRAVARVREITDRAVREHLLEPLAELRALSAANDGFDADAAKMLKAIRNDLIGAPPTGTRATDAHGRYWEKVPDSVATDKPLSPPARPFM